MKASFFALLPMRRSWLSWLNERVEIEVVRLPIVRVGVGVDGVWRDDCVGGEVARDDEYRLTIPVVDLLSVWFSTLTYPTAQVPSEPMANMTPPKPPSSLHLLTTLRSARSQQSTSPPSPLSVHSSRPSRAKATSLIPPVLPVFNSATTVEAPAAPQLRTVNAPRRPATASSVPSGEKAWVDSDCGEVVGDEPQRERGERRQRCDSRSYV